MIEQLYAIIVASIAQAEATKQQCRIKAWTQNNHARWYFMYMGWDNYTSGWCAGEVDFY